MAAQTIEDLFAHELEDIYFAEHELTESYERIAEQVEDDELRDLVESHIEETGTHIERLVDVFETMGEPPQTEECEGIEGLLTEWEEFADENEPGPVLDYYNLVTLLKTERYEQTAYESLVALAERQGRDEAADLLRSNLEEDEANLDRLAEMAESFDYDSLS
ncbi:ferritin-like domain-containing protein [Halobium palmae]|uniref:Ferritin-like domain-containing protein n=1 Tax=Halobium palmae TaxID=1776492 RepID=A0ABD5S0U6_9EURY